MKKKKENIFVLPSNSQTLFLKQLNDILENGLLNINDKNVISELQRLESNLRSMFEVFKIEKL